MNKFKEILKKEFINGKTTFDWCFLCFGLLLQIFAIVYGFIIGNPDSIISIISGISGVISVVLCAQGKISQYFFGYIQLLTYVFGIAIPYSLWGEVGENVFYFITMIIGTIIWFKKYEKNDKDELIIKSNKLTIKGWVLYLIIMCVGTVILGFGLKYIHLLIPGINADPTPWFDSITTVAPFIAQILLMFGYREQWIFWIVEDICSLIMFIILGNWIMVAQYLFWTVNCIYGWYKWSKTIKNNNNSI